MTSVNRPYLPLLPRISSDDDHQYPFIQNFHPEARRADELRRAVKTRPELAEAYGVRAGKEEAWLARHLLQNEQYRWENPQDTAIFRQATVCGAPKFQDIKPFRGDAYGRTLLAEQQKWINTPHQQRESRREAVYDQYTQAKKRSNASYDLAGASFAGAGALLAIDGFTKIPVSATLIAGACVLGGGGALSAYLAQRTIANCDLAAEADARLKNAPVGLRKA